MYLAYVAWSMVLNEYFQAHAYFSLSANWTRHTRHIFASVFPVPQRYYVPERIRDAYKPRLEAAELWDVIGVQEEEEREKHHFSFRRPLRKTKKAAERLKVKENLQRKKVRSPVLSCV